MNLLKIKINSLSELKTCVSLASLLELAGWPKPGNVHRTQNFINTRYEHFLAGISAIHPVFNSFCDNIYNDVSHKITNYSFVKLGHFFKSAVKPMMRWQSGGNVLLGHILVLAPLCASSCICLKLEKKSLEQFTSVLEKIINDATVNDTINLYNAINFSNPGGLGKVEKFDLNDPDSLIEIEQKNIKLKQIFELSKEYDLISLEYSTGFKIIIDEGLPYFLKTYKKYSDINIATVNTFLELLSNHIDTLIVRKSGKNAALLTSKAAFKALQEGGAASRKGLKLIVKLDKELQKERGKMNPGTIADLTAGIIFCALIFGLKF